MFQSQLKHKTRLQKKKKKKKKKKKADGHASEDYFFRGGRKKQLIYCFFFFKKTKQYINLSRVILCTEVIEPCTLTFLCSYSRDFAQLWYQVFLSNINNYMVSSNYFYLIIIICLHTVI